MKNDYVLIVDENSSDKKSTLDEMGAEIYELCDIFSQQSNTFDKKKALYSVVNYTKKYDRLLYANISNYIFDIYQTSTQRMGIFETNLESLANFVLSGEFTSLLGSVDSVEKQWLLRSEKIVIKIYDHVNLAKRQFNVLKTSDKEYENNFKKYILPFKQEVTKEMSSQLITLVGIFTAMAFLVFGGISSLNNIFGKIETIPILKLMIMCCLWGLGILNLVYIFMFCVGKMTVFRFNSNNKIVIWSNFLLISVFVFSLLFYYIDKNNMTIWFDKWCFKHSHLAVVLGIGIPITIWLCIVIIYFILEYKEQNGPNT